MHEDKDVETLLDLHEGGGYWIRIEAWRVEPTPTLHEPYGTRILGFDNAYAVHPGSSNTPDASSRHCSSVLALET